MLLVAEGGGLDFRVGHVSGLAGERGSFADRRHPRVGDRDDHSSLVCLGVCRLLLLGRPDEPVEAHDLLVPQLPLALPLVPPQAVVSLDPCRPKPAKLENLQPDVLRIAVLHAAWEVLVDARAVLVDCVSELGHLHAQALHLPFWLRLVARRSAGAGLDLPSALGGARRVGDVAARVRVGDQHQVCHGDWGYGCCLRLPLGGLLAVLGLGRADVVFSPAASP